MATDRRILAFRKVRDVLRADPDLRRLVRNWYVEPATAGDLPELPANVTSIRLTPRLGPERPYAQVASGAATYRTENAVEVEVRVGSSKWEDSATIWQHIANALAFDRAWQADGIDDLDPITPSDSALNQGAGRGEIRFITYVSR